MKIIYINFSDMSKIDVEQLLENIIKTDLNEKKCSVTIQRKNIVHAEHIEFTAKCAGVKLMGFLEAQGTFYGPEDMEMNYDLNYFML